MLRHIPAARSDEEAVARTRHVGRTDALKTLGRNCSEGDMRRTQKGWKVRHVHSNPQA
jgi:hypothetical protein